MNRLAHEYTVTRRIRLWGSLCLAGLAICTRATAGAGGVPVTMDLDFSARAVKESSFDIGKMHLPIPSQSQCYLCVRQNGKARPLFVTGYGRRGKLSLTFRPDTVVPGGYVPSVAGNVVADLHGYQVSPEAEQTGVAGEEWLGEREKWRVKLSNFRDIAAPNPGRLGYFVANRYRVVKVTKQTPPNDLDLKAKVDVELRSPTGTTKLVGQDAVIKLSVGGARKWTMSHNFWRISVSTAIRVNEGQPGSRKGDGHPLDIDVVVGTTVWVPHDVRKDDAPDLDDGASEAGFDVLKGEVEESDNE